jgi:acetyl esterase/lipase
VQPDLAFGPNDRHRLDLYMPDGATTDTPLVLFLCGGGWRWGSRGRYGFVGYALASRGFAVAVADYRLHPEVKFPAFNYDAARAAAWLQSNRERFGLAPGPLHLVGHSAGAHIAALVALDPRYLGEWDLTPKDIGRLVGLSGPYGMHPSRVGFIADIFPPAEYEAEARPVAFARAGAPPMLLHGVEDSLVAPLNSLRMAEAQTA